MYGALHEFVAKMLFLCLMVQLSDLSELLCIPCVFNLISSLNACYTFKHFFEKRNKACLLFPALTTLMLSDNKILFFYIAL